MTIRWSKQTQCLYFILALAFSLRVVGIGYGLPWAYHQDEPIVLNHALGYAGGDFNPHFFKIPPLTSYVLSILFGILFAGRFLLEGISVESFALEFFEDPTLFYAVGRFFMGAVLGTLSVWILYRLARNLLGTGPALWSALLFAVSFLHVRDSHYLYADIPMLLCLLASTTCLVDYQATGQRRYMIGAGLWAGVSVAFKYIAAPVFLPIFFIGKDRKVQLKAVCAGVIAYALLNPFSFLDWSFFWSEIMQQAKSESARPFLHHLFYSLGEGQGLMMTGLGLWGSYCIWKRERSMRWLFVFPGTFYFLIVFFSQPYERYAMPVLPFLCLGAGHVLFKAMDRTTARSRNRVILLASTVLFIIGPTLSKSLYMDWLMLKPDTRTQALSWTLAHWEANQKIVVDHPFFSPPFKQTADQILGKMEKAENSKHHRDLKLQKIHWMLKAQKNIKAFEVYYLNEGGIADTQFLTATPPVEANTPALENARIEYYVRYRHKDESDFFESHVRPKAILLKAFSPYRNPEKIYNEDPWANVALPFLTKELFSRNFAGPYLEIYQLRTDPS